MSVRLARIALLALTGFSALTAIGGGTALVLGLDRFPASWLLGTPFRSYVVPGLILAFVVGGSALVAFVLWWRSGRAAAWASVLAGSIMMGWIAGEVLMLKQPVAPTPIEVTYFAIGALTLALGLFGAKTVERAHATVGPTS